MSDLFELTTIPEGEPSTALIFNVVTSPARDILLILLFPLSTTTISDDEGSKTPAKTSLNCAADPIPS